jgi:glutamyl-Q tRNA(Asp) synthetase
MPSEHYRGRFAPSPTGRLHFGSIVAAVASHADARHADGRWLVRIEDVDQTRTRPGAEEAILRDLDLLGMRSDEPPRRQSEREPRYAEILARLVDAGLAYRCSCSRRDIVRSGRAGPEGPIYPGTCRRHPPDPGHAAAWRAVSADGTIHFMDRIQGTLQQDVKAEIGDFVIRRVDGFTAYQLAVVVDDHDQGITHVVRGADLLWSTPRQIALQRSLGFMTPSYAHIPLIYGADGKKLSKRDAAHPVDTSRPVSVLTAAWRFLGQAGVPHSLDDSRRFWEWAIPRWDITRIPREVRNNERTDTL